MGEVDPEHPLNEPSRPGAYAPAVVDTFHSVAEARDIFERLAQSYMSEHSLGIEDHRDYETRLNIWGEAFDSWVEARQSCFSDSERRAIALLKMHQVYYEVSITMAMDTPFSEDLEVPYWMGATPYFSRILDYAEQAIGLEEKSTTPIFYLDSGIAGTMFFTIMRCADATVRQRAIRLLRSSVRQEGFWNCDLTVRVAERIDSLQTGGIEEASPSQGFLMPRQVRGVKVHFHPDDKRVTVHFKWTHDSLLEEEFTW